jgi:hypothetical protein
MEIETLVAYSNNLKMRDFIGTEPIRFSLRALTAKQQSRSGLKLLMKMKAQ